MADPDPPSSGVPVIAWEREPTGVTEMIADGAESPLQRVDRRVGNLQKGTEVTIKMIQDHSAQDETALKAINDRLTTQDKTQLDHTIELRAQSRQLDTLVRVIAPRSGATSSQLRTEIQKQIDESDKTYRRNRNANIAKLIGAIVVAALGATAGIAAIINALRS